MENNNNNENNLPTFATYTFPSITYPSPNYTYTSPIEPNYNMMRFMLGMPMRDVPMRDSEEENKKEMLQNLADQKKKEEILQDLPDQDKWRCNTHEQVSRFYSLRTMTSQLKYMYIKWAKHFDNDSMSYINHANDPQYPKDNQLRILAKAYIRDISETKRLHNEEYLATNWTNIPYGITKDEWDNFVDDGIDIEYQENPCNMQ